MASARKKTYDEIRSSLQSLFNSWEDLCEECDIEMTASGGVCGTECMLMAEISDWL